MNALRVDSHTSTDVHLMKDSVNRELELLGYSFKYALTFWTNRKGILCQLVQAESGREVSPIMFVSDMYDTLATIQHIIQEMRA